MTTSLATPAVRVPRDDGPAIEHLFNYEYMPAADGNAARRWPSAREAEPVAGQEQLTHGLAEHLDGHSATAEGPTRAAARMGQYNAPPRNNAPTCRISNPVAILSAPESIAPDLRLSGIETREQKYTQPQDAWHLGSGFGRVICQRRKDASDDHNRAGSARFYRSMVMRSRAFRHHQAERNMRRRLKEDRNQHYDDLSCACWYDPRIMARFKEQPKRCSCFMCGNRRQSEGPPIQERKWAR